MSLFIVFLGIIVIVGIVSNVSKQHNKSNDQSHHIHSTNDFLTHDTQISSQDSHHCADSSSPTSDSSCGSSAD
ncbi:hypothetical protein VYF65_001698 [Lysinibacillus irui]|uniref:hypothetical protein n=1 Tax=Lysinibacillus irui TaxID=2998077 RepID=UPI0038898525